MNSYDLLLLLFIGGWLLFEVRQEAGRSVADAVATFLALHMTGQLAPGVTAALRWQPYAETAVSPGAELLCFLLLWAGGLFLAREWHRRTRWSADVLNPLVGVACGGLVALMAGHVMLDSTATMALMQHGELPTAYTSSRIAEELRTFQSYQQVVSTFQGYEYQPASSAP